MRYGLVRYLGIGSWPATSTMIHAGTDGRRLDLIGVLGDSEHVQSKRRMSEREHALRQSHVLRGDGRHLDGS